MNIVVRILSGLAAVAVGLFFVFRSGDMVDFLGPIDMVDEKLGGGGTRLFYKLLGTVVVVVGFLVMTNLWTAFLGATIGSFFPKRGV